MTLMINEVLKSYRAIRNLTLKEMEDKIGIPSHALLRMEHGHNLNAKNMAKAVSWLMQENKD